MNKAQYKRDIRNASKKPKRVHSLKDLSLQALRCHRLRRHSYDTDGIFQVSNGWQETLVCGNCGTVRIDDIDPDSLEITRHDYSWQDNYLLSFNVDGADCRREEIARILPRVSE
jgi:hypothetical protein